MARRERREKGSGSIFRRGDVFIAQVQAGYTVSGRPKYKQRRCKTRTAAVKALNEMTSLLVQGKVIPGKNGYTVSSWLDTWLVDHIKTHREPKTYDFYRTMARHIRPIIGRQELQKLTAADVSRLFSTMEKSGATTNTIQAVRRTLRAAIGVATKYGHIAENPVTKAFSPRITRTERLHFDAAQIRALLEALKGSPIENLVSFTLATGMRLGEATGVTWSAIDMNRKQVIIQAQLQRIGGQLRLKQLKTDGSRRTVPLVGQALAAVLNEEARKDSQSFTNNLNLVFTNPWGRPLDPKYVNSKLHQALKKAGLPRAGMHVLRHSAATFMLMAGLNLHQVSRYLGHSQITLTSNLYGHVLNESMRDAALRLQEMYESKSDR
jgi:integrase